MSDCAPEAVVQAQVEAYNRQDLAAFIGTYSDDAVLYDHPGVVWLQGREAVEREYAPRFTNPAPVTVAIRSRIVSGEYVVDEEIPSRAGRAFGQAVAIYQVRDCRIRRVDFLPQLNAAGPQ